VVLLLIVYNGNRKPEIKYKVGDNVICLQQFYVKNYYALCRPTQTTTRSVVNIAL